MAFDAHLFIFPHSLRVFSWSVRWTFFSWTMSRLLPGYPVNWVSAHCCYLTSSCLGLTAFSLTPVVRSRSVILTIPGPPRMSYKKQNTTKPEPVIFVVDSYRLVFLFSLKILFKIAFYCCGSSACVRVWTWVGAHMYAHGRHVGVFTVGNLLKVDSLFLFSTFSSHISFRPNVISQLTPSCSLQLVRKLVSSLGPSVTSRHVRCVPVNSFFQQSVCFFRIPP